MDLDLGCEMAYAFDTDYTCDAGDVVGQAIFKGTFFAALFAGGAYFIGDVYELPQEELHKTALYGAGGGYMFGVFFETARHKK